MHINTSSINNEHDALAAVHELIDHCEQIGVHVTIETQSLQPLAMGNIRMVGGSRRSMRHAAH